MSVDRRTLAPVLPRRGVLKGAAAVTGAVLLPGTLRAAEPRRGGTLRVSMTYNPAALDPMTGRNAPDFNTLLAIYDGLIDLDPPTLQPKPGLAKAFTWKDPATLVLDLEQNVTFHDGTKFDAEAVKFNLDRYRSDARSNVKPDCSTIDRVDVAGPHQVVIHLNRPNSSLPTILADRPGLMVSPTAIQKADGGNIDRAPVGTGPFRFVSWQDNDRIVLTRNESYWRPGLPYLDALTLRIISEQPTGLRSVIAGENDMAINIDVQLKTVADRAGNLVARLVPTTFFWGAYINFAKPPLDNLKVRQALAWGIDREAMNKAIALGLDTPGNGVLPKEHWACDPATFNMYGYDPDKARKLLAEAGYPDGIDVPMIGWSDQTAMQRQEVAMAQLAKAGIRVQLTPASPQDSSIMFFGPQKKGSARMSGMGGYADPSQQYDNLLSKDAYYNAGRIELPGYRELINATQATDDLAARKAAFAMLQRFVIENALVLTFLFQTNLMIAQKSVQGVTVDLTNKPRFHAAWLAA
jgi:peptide/nickel transport system substrate-binding protein/glutathione transport system substrate-binding protein